MLPPREKQNGVAHRLLTCPIGDAVHNLSLDNHRRRPTAVQIVGIRHSKTQQ